MKYIKTDSRPWYKQAITGLMMAIIAVIAIPAALSALFVGLSLFAKIVTIGTSVFAAIGLVVSMLAMLALWDWAREGL